MSGLAEDTLDESPARVWAVRAGFGLGAIVVALAIVWAVRHLMSGIAAPRHQVAKISILPDAPPPPPPPPPKEEKKPEPKEQAKQQPQPDAPKQDKPPEPQQLKMEGPAGEGPSPFAGGDIKSDYIGGEVGNGGGDRFAFYADRMAQQIQEELSRRNLRGASARVLLWLSPDGSIQRFKLIQTSGNAETDRVMQATLSEMHRIREAPPADMPMPVGLEVSMR
ncbi:MAG: TonB C-terminal domain-containing protein [Nevskia sp.]|nr:TonB C-terminal domain-containing protein [Nevskia sp.]